MRRAVSASGAAPMLLGGWTMKRLQAALWTLSVVFGAGCGGSPSSPEASGVTSAADQTTQFGNMHAIAHTADNGSIESTLYGQDGAAVAELSWAGNAATTAQFDVFGKSAGLTALEGGGLSPQTANKDIYSLWNLVQAAGGQSTSGLKLESGGTPRPYCYSNGPCCFPLSGYCF
jgi:hypothetical protein